MEDLEDLSLVLFEDVLPEELIPLDAPRTGPSKDCVKASDAFAILLDILR